ncbi:MAG: tRNA (adenosine(37)-N6)-threonylcarbamoyltransferase complex ATPase subunit type 1 TsaE [Patescibacteria group bacterium]
MNTSKSPKRHRLFNIRIKSPSAKVTKKFGETLGLELRKKIPKVNGALVISLRGELGSGKTTLIQGIARGLGLKRHIVSPTFLLMRVYAIAKKQKRKLLHIDAYRIATKKDAAILENKDFFNNPAHIVAVEWPERIPHLMRKRTIEITIKHGTSEHERSIIMKT